MNSFETTLQNKTVRKHLTYTLARLLLYACRKEFQTKLKENTVDLFFADSKKKIFIQYTNKFQAYRN